MMMSPQGKLTIRSTNLVLLYYTGSGDPEELEQSDQWTRDGRLATSPEIVSY